MKKFAIKIYVNKIYDLSRCNPQRNRRFQIRFDARNDVYNITGNYSSHVLIKCSIYVALFRP